MITQCSSRLHNSGVVRVPSNLFDRPAYRQICMFPGNMQICTVSGRSKQLFSRSKFLFNNILEALKIEVKCINGSGSFVYVGMNFSEYCVIQNCIYVL